MKSKQYRIFNIDGKEMIFDTKKFINLFNLYAQKSCMGIGRYEMELADKLFIDGFAVHNWRFEKNGQVIWTKLNF